MIINKKILKNIPVIGKQLVKIYQLLKSKHIVNLFLEFYYHICSMIRKTTGITIEKRNPLLIVSLTTIPSRISRVYLAIESLLQQSIKPDYIILWLKENESSKEWLKSNNRTAKKLLNLKNRGLKIKFCKDLRSYTKILYTLKQYPEAIVVSADDDLYYPKNWLKELYDSYSKNPEYVHCHVAYFMKKASKNSLLSYNQWLLPHDNFQGPSNNIFPLTGTGCLFPPGSLHPEVFNEKVFLDISPYHDDAWFKAMTILNGVPSKTVKPISKLLEIVRGTGTQTLAHINVNQNQFDPQVEAIFKKYNLYKFLDDPDHEQH